ncbi:MAG: site-specific integrase, partial [Clostridia bacterium]|nr:site-specific integrase [Clostridia bacterium]
MKKLITAYENYLAENNAKNTVLSYMGDIARYLRDEEIKTKKDLLKVKEKDIAEYILALKRRGMAYSSVSRSVA